MRILWCTLCALGGIVIIACGPKQIDDKNYLTFAGQAMQDILPPMMQTLKEHVDKDGFANAVKFCSTFAGEYGRGKNAEWSKKAQADFGIKVFRFRRISDRNRNPQNAPDMKQAEILTAWRANGAKPTLYRDGARLITLHPIKIPMEMCLGCHGDSEHLDKSAAVEIAKLYPHDRATGYKLGELRGAFVTEATLGQ